jgi:hypothetical protein
MKTEEAIEICQGWFAYLKRRVDKSIEMQRLATLARTDPKEARRLKEQLDTHSVTVYDSSRLEIAVRHLVGKVSEAHKE